MHIQCKLKNQNIELCKNSCKSEISIVNWKCRHFNLCPFTFEPTPVIAWKSNSNNFSICLYICWEVKELWFIFINFYFLFLLYCISDFSLWAFYCCFWHFYERWNILNIFVFNFYLWNIVSVIKNCWNIEKGC